MNQNKRFVNIGKDIMQDDEVWCTAGGEHCADVIATALNTALEENKKLREKASGWKLTADSQIIENSMLWNEIKIMMDQGAEPSEAFKIYAEALKNEEFWNNDD